MSFVFHFEPKGAKPRSWPFAPAEMTNGEAEEIEDITGLTFIEWQDRVLRGSVGATHALLWLHLRKDAGDLRFDAVQFKVGETRFEWTDEDEDDEGDEGDEPEPADEVEVPKGE